MRKPDARKEPMSAVGNYIDMLEKKIVELDKEIETLSGEVEQYKCQLKKERLTTAETFPVWAVDVDLVHRVIEIEVEKGEIES